MNIDISFQCCVSTCVSVTFAIYLHLKISVIFLVGTSLSVNTDILSRWAFDQQQMLEDMDKAMRINYDEFADEFAKISLEITAIAAERKERRVLVSAYWRESDPCPGTFTTTRCTFTSIWYTICECFMQAVFLSSLWCLVFVCRIRHVFYAEPLSLWDCRLLTSPTTHTTQLVQKLTDDGDAIDEVDDLTESTYCILLLCISVTPMHACVLYGLYGFCLCAHGSQSSRCV